MKHKELFDIAIGIRLTALELGDNTFRTALHERIFSVAEAVQKDMKVPIKDFVWINPNTELKGPNVQRAIQAMLKPFPQSLIAPLASTQPEELKAAA